jgi:hypothetical protein
VQGSQTDAERQDPQKNKSLKQRWFRGVHSDVGGGYDRVEAGLSDCSYAWILSEAIDCGLRTLPKLTNTEWMKKPYIAHDECASMPWWGIAGLVSRSNRIKINRDGKSVFVPIDEEEGIAIYDEPVGLGNFFRGHRVGLIFNGIFSLLMAWIASRYAYAALHGGSLKDNFDNLFGGSACFDFWQRYIVPIGCSGAQINEMRMWPSYAYHAMLFDFLFILFYSWLLGLFAGWAFREVMLNRRPDAQPDRLLWLGWAPCYLVFANVAENILTILTVWLLDNKIHGFTDYSRFLLPDRLYGWWKLLLTFFQKHLGPHFWISDITGFMLSVANILKWMGFVGSLALIVWGAACHIIRWSAESKSTLKANAHPPAGAAAASSGAVPDAGAAVRSGVGAG